MTDMSWMPWVVGGVMVLSFLYMKKYLLLFAFLFLPTCMQCFQCYFA